MATRKLSCTKIGLSTFAIHHLFKNFLKITSNLLESSKVCNPYNPEILNCIMKALICHYFKCKHEKSVFYANHIHEMYKLSKQAYYNEAHDRGILWGFQIY